MKRISSLFKKGYLYLFTANTVRKIAAFCSSIILARLLSKKEFGAYSYVMNLVNIILIGDGIGTVTGILQYGCENRCEEEKCNNYIKYGMSVGIIANVVLSLVIAFYGLFICRHIEYRMFFLIAALLPISSYISEAFTVIFRVKDNNRGYFSFSILGIILTYVGIITGAYFSSIAGIIGFRCFSLVIVSLIGFLFYPTINRVFGVKSPLNSQKQIDRKGFLKFSFLSCINNSVALLFYNMDMYFIGKLLFDEELIASYKIATTVPLGLVFISSSIIMCVYPSFVAHQNDRDWLRKQYLYLLTGLLCLNGFIFLIGFLFAPYVISLLFGFQYVEQATPFFRILMVGFFISSSFRVPAGNVLDMLHLVTKNLKISVVSGLLNILLDYALILKLGAYGAAYATVAIYFFYALLSNIAVFKYIHNIKKECP